MKITEFLVEELKLSPPFDMISGQQLVAIKHLIDSCEELKGCQIELIDNQEINPMMTYKVPKEGMTPGKFFLYSMGITPEIYDPLTWFYLKDGQLASISPSMYSTIDFTPSKRIQLVYDKEKAKDSGKNDLEYRKEMHELLDSVIDNPELYRMKGLHGLMIRGYFEKS